MSAPQKLTKKQKKGVAFRERKSSKHAHASDSLAANDVPILEVQDGADDAGATVEGAAVVEPKNSKGKETGSTGKAKAQDPVGVAPVQAVKKRKRTEEDVVAEGSSDETKIEAAPKKKKKTNEDDKKQRFILFVGNLKYTTSLDVIKGHFESCDPPPTVRLLTPKPMPGKPANKSKGCAFLEFSHRNALQQGLKLHQSQLDGRMINVELTAGGGGKSETRLQKVKERNKGLHGQRKEKFDKDGKEGGTVSTMAQPQRFSATSGIEQAPQKQRTWTVSDSVDNKPHRGGVKHTKTRVAKRPSKPWGTGVNAIPVG